MITDESRTKQNKSFFFRRIALEVSLGNGAEIIYPADYCNFNQTMLNAWGDNKKCIRTKYRNDCELKVIVNNIKLEIARLTRKKKFRVIYVIMGYSDFFTENEMNWLHNSPFKVVVFVSKDFSHPIDYDTLVQSTNS